MRISFSLHNNSSNFAVYYLLTAAAATGLLFLLLIINSVEGIISDDDDDENLEKSPVVQTKYGPVEGVIHKGHYEFRGIPFAKAPVGSLRFKVPQEPEPWTEVLDANKFPPYCIQYNVFWNTTEGEEDCLYLTVFTPGLPEEDVIITKKSRAALPVMVYIHSGGFMFGRGSQFRGDYLMEHKDVVLVVFNYRLGSFGFLNTGDKESFGNMGMKDQVLALKWVQNVIPAFGGDPSRVFIFGTSAGSASVHYHILSPRSKGLFHTAYSGSGSALNPWAFQPDPVPNGRKLGRLVGCPEEPSKALVKCLRRKDAHEIAFCHSRFLDFYSDPIAAFGPSIEVGNPDELERFLDDTPRNVVERGEVNEVPWMIGFDTDEGYEHTLGILNNEVWRERLNAEWEDVFPLTLEYVNEPEERKAEISRKLREFYFRNEEIRLESPKNLSNAYSDKTFIHGIIEAAVAHAKLGRKVTHPVYLFNFAYEGPHSIVTLRGYPRDGFVANHMDDIQYLLKSFLFPFIEKEQDGSSHHPREFQQKFLKMVTSFVATGSIPAFDKSQPDQKWEPLSSQKDAHQMIRYYHITESPKMSPISDELQKRQDFWNSLNLREYQVTSNDDDDDDNNNKKELKGNEKDEL